MRQCIVQPGNLTGCGREGVKGGGNPCSGVYLHGSIKRKVSQDKRSPIEGLRLTKLLFQSGFHTEEEGITRQKVS